MEAVPRMPMLAFELKNCTELVEFSPILKSYIGEFYHEDPESYNKECTELDQLRQVAVRVSRDFMGCSTLKKYYCQLQFIQSRFPMGEGGMIALPFTWEDVFSGRPVTLADIRFEQASILYNIGALHSGLGALDNRQTPEGMKVSCTHFQCAAWAFQHLRDYYGSSMSIDMNHDLLTFQFNLMLAQAQECILEKSMTDNRKSSITAKVAAQIVEYYRIALKNLDATDPSQLLGSRKYKEWKKRIDLRMSYHQCIQYMYQGQQSEDQQKWGERLAFYQASLDKLNVCIKMNKDEEGDISESLRFTMDVVGGRYNAAKKDNDFVYHEKVPDLDSLPDVKGASLVKGIPFNPEDKEVSGPDIFQRLVPMEAHEASSLYSEEKAKLLRCVGTKIEDKNLQLSQYMGSLQLDPDCVAPQPDRLPQHLLEKCAAISVRPDAIKDLVASMTSLSSIATDVESNIHEIMDLLESEERQESEYQDAFGKRRRNIVLEEIGKECRKYEEGLTKASLSNQELHKAMNTHINNLKLLSGPLDELQAALPSVELERSPEDETMAKDVKRLLDKVEEMKVQREALSEQLRQRVHADDITTDIVTRDEGDQEDFFKKQLSKHDKVVVLIDQNLNAQDNILHALTEANANFASVRKSNADTNTKRDHMIRGLVQSYDVYEDLLAKSQKGVEFYSKLETNVARLLTRTRGVCKVQQEERDMAMARLRPKDPPPSRPTAPKPGQAPAAFGEPSLLSGPVPPGALQPGPMPDIGLPGEIPSALEAAMRLASDPHGASRGNMGLPPASVSAPHPSMAPDASAPAPRLTLKDYLPFMKPKSFGGARHSANMDAAAAMGAMGSIPGMGQVPSMPAHSGSLPGSLSASPIHLPPQAASQPGSPHHMPGRDAAALGQPQMRTHLPRPTSTSPVPPIVNPALSMANRYPGIDIPPEMITSPTAAPGAPSARRHFPPAGPLDPSVQPPGGPGSASGPHAPPAPRSQPGPMYPHPPVPHAMPTGQPPVVSMPPGVSQPPPQAGNPGSGANVGHMPQVQQPQHGAHAQNYHMAQAQYPAPQRQPHAAPLNHPSPAPSPQQPHPAPAPVPQYPAYSAANPHQPTMAPNTQAYHAPGQPLSVTSQPAASSVGGGAPNPVPQQAGGHMPGQPQPYAAPTPAQPNSAMTGPSNPPYSAAPGGGYAQHGQFPVSGYQQSLPAPMNTYAGQAASSTEGPKPAASPALASTHTSQVNTAGGYLASQALPGSHQSQMANTRTGIYASAGSAGPMAAANTWQGTPSMGGQGMQQGQIGAPVPSHGQSGPVQAVGPTVPAAIQPRLLGPGAVPQQYQPQTGVPGQVRPAVAPNSTQPNYRYPHAPGVNPPVHTSSGQVYQQPGPGMTQKPGNYPAGSQIPQPQAAQSHVSTNQLPTSAIHSYQQPGSQPQYAPRGNMGQTVHAPRAPQAVPAPRPVHVAMGSGPGNPASNVGAAQYTLATGQYPQQQRPPQNIQVPQTNNQPGQPVVGQVHPQPGPPQATTNQVPPGQVANQGQWRSPAPGGYPPQSVPQPQYPTHQPHQPQPTQPSQAMYHQNTGQQAYSQPRPQAFPHQPGHQQQQPAASASGYMQQPPNATGVYQQQQPHPPQQPHQPMGFPQQSYKQPPTSLPTQTGFISPTGGPLPVTNLPSPLQPTVAAPASTAPQPQIPLPTPGTPTDQRANSLPPGGQEAVQRQESTLSAASSLDDILSSSPDASKGQSSALPGVLKPQVITADDIRRQKEEEMKNSLKNTKDPYADPGLLDRFTVEVENFAKHVEALCKQTLSGPTPLDKEWKDLGDEQEKISRKNSMAIARCYPMKNRFQDIMPYDNTRVVLTTSNDDYINGTNIDDLGPSSPKFIVTQAPLPATMIDFWQMVYEQGVEVIVMLCQEKEPGKHKSYVYWPTEKGKPASHGQFQLTLQSIKVKQGWEERILTFTNRNTHQSRSVVHLQFNKWPTSGVPASPVELLSFINEVHSFYIQQRSLMKPVIVHCSNGVGRSGTFCVTYTGIEEINQGKGIIPIRNTVLMARQKRKYMVQEKEQLKFCYDAILYYSQELLMKRGILTNRVSFGDKLPQPGERSHQRTPSADFIMNNTGSLRDIQSSVAKMSVRAKPEDVTNGDDAACDNGISNGNNPPVLTVASDPAVGTPMTESRPPAQPQIVPGTDSPVRLRAGTGHSDSPGQRSRSGSASSDPSHQSGSCSLTASPQHKPVAAGGASVPLSLADLQNPNTFTLDRTPPSKRRFTKASFTNPSSSISDTAKDTSDPLNMLDPLWTVKSDK